MLHMTLKEIIARWRQLTPEEKLRRRWGGDSAGCGSEHGLRGGTGASGDNPRCIRQNPQATYPIIAMLSACC